MARCVHQRAELNGEGGVNKEQELNVEVGVDLPIRPRCTAAFFDTDSEEWRHECELRYIERMESERGRLYIYGVLKARGNSAAQRIIEDLKGRGTWARFSCPEKEI
jgi:hypothetical protein